MTRLGLVSFTFWKIHSYYNRWLPNLSFLLNQALKILKSSQLNCLHRCWQLYSQRWCWKLFVCLKNNTIFDLGSCKIVYDFAKKPHYWSFPHNCWASLLRCLHIIQCTLSFQDWVYEIEISSYHFFVPYFWPQYSLGFLTRTTQRCSTDLLQTVTAKYCTGLKPNVQYPVRWQTNICICANVRW